MDGRKPGIVQHQDQIGPFRQVWFKIFIANYFILGGQFFAHAVRQQSFSDNYHDRTH
jgi:hypothetical protein